MSSCPVFSGSSPAVVSLDRAQGKPLQSLQVYQTEDALNLDLQFDDGIALELIFRVGFRAFRHPTRIHEWKRSRSQENQAEAAQLNRWEKGSWVSLIS